MTGQERVLLTLAEVESLHARSESLAGEYDDGTCAYCQADPSRPVLRRFRDYLNGGRTKVWMHAHEDRHPYCGTCAAGWDGRQDWPCSTWNALQHLRAAVTS